MQPALHKAPCTAGLSPSQETLCPLQPALGKALCTAGPISLGLPLGETLTPQPTAASVQTGLLLEVLTQRCCTVKYFLWMQEGGPPGKQPLKNMTCRSSPEGIPDTVLLLLALSPLYADPFLVVDTAGHGHHHSQSALQTAGAQRHAHQPCSPEVPGVPACQCNAFMIVRAPACTSGLLLDC